MSRLELSWGLLFLVLAGCGMYMEPEVAGNEASAIGLVRTVAKAQEVYKNEGLAGQELVYAETLAELARAGLIDEMFQRTRMRRGYVFRTERTEEGFEAVAVPDVWGETGERSFFIDQTGVMRWARGREATSDDKVLQ